MSSSNRHLDSKVQTTNLMNQRFNGNVFLVHHLDNYININLNLLAALKRCFDVLININE